MHPALERFSPATREWFAGAFPEPTPAQLGAWEAISSGRHALVVAPTGSGKTLSAFLWSLDRLATSPRPANRGARTRVLYLSPLKALGVDVERNLRAPLVGITQTAKRLGLEPPEITVGVRSGDTPTSERRALQREPPDVLITTPESLFLMLTSSARETLAHVETVIIDEVHAVAATKRGAHLAVSLERLDALLARPAQRIGLSATVRPLDEVARFLGGAAPVELVQPPAAKTFELRVVVPVEDMRSPGPLRGAPDADESELHSAGSIWPHVDESIVDEVLRHRSTIVFANSRRLAERLTARLNEVYAERLGEDSPGRYPAEAVAGSGITGAARLAEHAAPDAPLLARAHHGSVSKEQRALIEDDLKQGRLRCVVATSSLELGIDMGAVDLVIQVEAPPSVASALQRVGRAGHQVGEISKGVLYPKHRADLLHTSVASERMTAGLIEQLRVPQNPLDILAQQTVAAVALEQAEPLTVDAWFETVRRSAPFASLPRSAFEATLDLLAGRYPSDQFAELRPRIVWDRVAGTITGRPGAQRLAVTSGGTIPDRGLFGVFLVGSDSSGAPGGRRVGELDEEMVYESRVGDVFALGATSWRIEEITSDRVLVSPAFGQPGRVPFWKGDGLGRPAELGAAIGAFTRELTQTAPDDPALRARLERAGLDPWAVDNLLGFVRDQQAATGSVPTDRTLVVERFRDELGDWRLVLHSPFGLPVHAPWALAVNARIRERHGVESSAMAGDDGIVVRLPETDAEPPGAELFLFEPDELDALVTNEVGGSALFASRFRECAARALLLPRRDPGRRSPLWQQRQRSAQLLEVARQFPSFPIILETVREVLQDVYDLPALTELSESIRQRRVRVVEVETDTPSPFAGTLLFGYVAAFLYEGDSPLAERRAAALSLDPTLLAELLGRAELRELLDPEVLAQTERELQRLTPERAARDAEGLVDLLRVLGPLSTVELAERFRPEPLAFLTRFRPERAETLAPAPLEPDLSALSGQKGEGGEGGDRAPRADEAPVAALLDELARANRVIRATIAGEPRWATIEDASRLRDALGVPLPIGVPTAFLDPVSDPLGDLVSRYLRTHGPFTASEAAARLGLGVAVVSEVLARFAADRRAVEGEFRPGASGGEWVDPGVLRRLRARSLAALRAEVEPVPQRAFARFLADWHHVGAPGSGGLRGIEGVLAVIDQLQGVALPASTWESLVLPARVRDFSPAMLDELTTTGEVLWAGAGELPAGDGWVSLHLAESAPLSLAAQPAAAELLAEPSALQRRLLIALGAIESDAGLVVRPGGAFFARQLQTAASDAEGPPPTEAELARALWELVWAGLVGNDTFAPLRARLGATSSATRSRATPRGRVARARARATSTLASSSPSLAGRWSLLPQPAVDATRRASAAAEGLLERHGVVTRGAVQSEQLAGGFALAYRVLSKLEEAGRARRGYFVEGLGAAQFATPATVDRLRAVASDLDRAGAASDHPPHAVTLAATDPANPYGAALAWPATEGHRPGRKAGALVVLVDGALVLYLERGGKTVLSFAAEATDADATAARERSLRAASASLAATVRAAGGRLRIERIDGGFSVGSELGHLLEEVGFAATPQGLRLRSAS